MTISIDGKNALQWNEVKKSHSSYKNASKVTVNQSLRISVRSHIHEIFHTGTYHQDENYLSLYVALTFTIPQRKGEKTHKKIVLAFVDCFTINVNKG